MSKTLPPSSSAGRTANFSAFNHYGRRALCRVLSALPSVETRALSKEAVCRVLHSAKPALGKGRLCRVPNTRQRGTLGKRPLCRVSGTRQRITLGKIPQLTSVAPPSSFAECWPLALGKRAVFAECLAWHSAKRFLCRVPISTLGKVFLFFIYFCF